MTWSDLAADLVGTFPGLPPLQAETHVRKAWLDVCNARLWSYLMVTGGILCPGQITAGTVTCTQGSTTVTFDATAHTALSAYAASTPAGFAPLTVCQFRAQGNSLYNLSTVALPVATLDRAFIEPSGAGQGYQIYRCYLRAPSTDFLRWESLDDFQNGYHIGGDRLSRSRAEFDGRDPQRQSQGQAYFLGQETGQQTDYPFWELWPHPTDGQTWLTTYRSKGVDPDFSSSILGPPPIIPDSLITLRATGWYTYQWIQANRGVFPRYQKTDFYPLIKDAKDQYSRQLLDVKRVDDEQALQTVYNRGRMRSGRRFPTDLSGPADSNYWQSHGVWW